MDRARNVDRKDMAAIGTLDSRRVKGNNRRAVLAILFALGFMNLAQSFVIQPTILPSGRAHNGYGVAPRTTGLVSLTASAEQSRHREPSLSRGRKACGSTLKATLEGGGDADRPRAAKSRLSLEDAASESKSGVAFLSGKKDGLGTDSGGGNDDGIKGGGGGQGGGGGGGEGEGEGENEGTGDGDGVDEELDIAAKGRKRERIVRKVEKAVDRGRIPKESAKAYAQLLSSPATAMLCRNSGWRARLLGDTAFMTKLTIEMVTGIMSQCLAEYQKRGSKFMNELDFVLADTLTCLFANFAAVWLSCPTVAVKATKAGAAKAGGALQQFLASCPTNAFQKVTTEGGVTSSFTVYQRGASLFIPMPKLFVIGFIATVAGFGLIAGLEKVQTMGGKGGEAGVKTPPGDKKPSVPVFGSGLAIGAFLAVSTNLRYQLIAGAIEQRLFDTLLSSNPGLSSLGSTIVRSANLYIGSLTIVDWLRYVGLQH